MREGTIRRLDLAGAAIALLTLALVIIWAFPLVWAIATTVVPRGPNGSIVDVLSMYGGVLINTRIGQWYLNSLVTSGGVTLIVLAISAGCGYAISQLDFTGRKVLVARTSQPLLTLPHTASRPCGLRRGRP